MTHSIINLLIIIMITIHSFIHSKRTFVSANKNSKKTPTAKWECDNGYTEIEGKCFKLMTAKGELDYEAAKELCREEEEALIAMPKTKGITKGLEKLR